MKKLMTLMICLMIAVITWKDGSMTTVKYESKNDYPTHMQFNKKTGNREGSAVNVYLRNVRMIEYREGDK